VADILPFKKRKVTRKGKTLCASNHHKWVVDKQNQFDVKSGKLVTRYRCTRCGKEKVTSH